MPHHAYAAQPSRLRAIGISFAVAIGILALFVLFVFAPTTLVHSAAESPDGKWSARIEVDVSQVSVATPISRVVLKRKVLGITFPQGHTLVQWNQAFENESATVRWQGPGELHIGLPPAANEARTESSFEGVQVVRYSE